jgi:hypothetical protein
LLGICENWADAALNLSDSDLKVMSRLARAQERLSGLTPPHPTPSSHQRSLAMRIKSALGGDGEQDASEDYKRMVNDLYLGE